MASTLLQSQLTPSISHLSPKPPSLTTTKPMKHKINCGPRSNRGPLVKGRVLSTEAIQAVQALKRAQRSPTTPTPINSTLKRLIKSDLLATLRELLRQGHCDLALAVFSTVRSEPWYTTVDLSLYADLVLALGKKGGMEEDIDRLIEGMEREIDGGECGFDWEDMKGLRRLVKAVIGAERRESTVRIYGVMKKCGWGQGQGQGQGGKGSGVEVDEYLAKVLSKGFKRFGEFDLCHEVDSTLQNYLDACLGRGVAL